MKRITLGAIAVAGLVLGVLWMRTPSAPSCSGCSSSLTIGSEYQHAHGRTRSLGLLAFMIGGSIGIGALRVHRAKQPR